ncbi:hypothetical protein RUM44_010598 [Polyplax serrata]|uniref:PHD-type domain-containing protein n=1 Tax=Polyplax serrata TaxID=468196 RepID=A0ABR1AWL9_POLSC
MPEDTEMPTVRQSRRIAQIKLKEEAERRRVEALQLETFKKKKTGKIKKGKSKKNMDSDSYDEKQDEDVDDSDDGKPKALKEKKSRRKKKDKLVFNELNPWESSSGSSTVDDEEDEIEEEPHEEEELTFKSDHEFSPESDVEDPDYKPMKRARTAKVEESKEEPGKYDDTSCEKCGKNDHPEWILLCDKCDKGWHASCVRPALMIVPEGDWYCPPCEHIALIQKLQESLVQYDRCQKQREIEETRKKRLAFVGISLDNVLPPTKKSSSKNDEDSGDEEDDSGSSSGSGSKSDSESDSEDEPIYQLRQRRSNVTSYRFNEFDELIKSALQDEMEAVRGAGNSGKGKDISNIVNAEKQRRQEEEIDNLGDKFMNCDKGAKEAEKTEGDKDGEVEAEEIGDGADTAENLSDEILPVVSRSIKKKKSKSVKITSLDFTSEEEDHNSDSDFKGNAAVLRMVKALRRNPNTAFSRKVNHQTAQGGEEVVTVLYDVRPGRGDDAPKRKKSRRDWDSSESSDSDRSWGRKKKKVQKSYGRGSSRRSRGKSKKKKQRRVSFESDEEESVTTKRSKNKKISTYLYAICPKIKQETTESFMKIKHVGLESLDEDTVLSRRTRGKKINYQEITGSDSEDNARNQKSRSSRVIESDDDFIAEKEGQDAESEDIDDSLEEEDEGSGNESSNSISVKKQKDANSELTEGKIMKKKKWVIPDPDDFSENDLMEDEQLDKFTEELEELDEEEEEILGNMLESGDVPINELKAAVKRAKEESKQRKVNVAKNKEREEKESGKTLAAESAGMEAEFTGGKFPKVGKIKVTPSRAQLASEVAVALAIPQEAPNAIPAKPTIFNESESSGNPGFLLKTLQGDVKHNIPVANHLPPYPLENTYGTYPGSSVPLNSLMTLVKPEEQLPNSEVSSSIKSGHQISEFGAFQRMVHGHRIASYPPTLPATVPGVSNLDPQTGLGTNQVKRKHDTSSESEGGNTSAAIDERSQSKRQDSPTKKKGRSRGKKQILDEPETQEKLDGLGSAVLPSDEGSVITRILNSPQGSQSYPRSDSNQFSVTPRSRPPFPPGISSHFPNQPPRPMASFRMRPPGPPGTMFRTSHPHDPSPSGGGAINIAIANRGMGKPAPGTPLPSFSKVPSLSGFPPRFVTSDPTGRAIYPSVNPGVRPDFPFGNFYGAFPQGAAPGPEGSAFHSGAFQQSFGDETQVGGQINPKQLDDEVGGEFGGLASYFASQREDDLDT